MGIFAFFAVGALVEDPPWVKRMRAKIIDFDYAGLGLIALGLGSFQIMLDRGEDDDWFSSPMIMVAAILGTIGVLGAIWWLLVAKKPIVNLRVFANRNFAVGSVMIFGMGMILYSGTVLLPQLSQQRLGYTATLAGLVLSPGALSAGLNSTAVTLDQRVVRVCRWCRWWVASLRWCRAFISSPCREPAPTSPTAAATYR